jgi:DNA-binding beta-propeller fold protein YncE
VRRGALPLLLLVPALARAAAPDPAGVAPGPPPGGAVQLRLLDVLPVSRWPKGVELTPDGRFAVVTSFWDNTIEVIDVASRRTVRRIDTGRSSPVEIAFHPDGTRAVVTGGWQLDEVLILDLRTWTVAHRIPGQAAGDPARRRSFPKVVTFSPDGSRFYVSYWKSSNVAVYSAYGYELLAVVPTGVNPRGIAITPDGKKGYVANFDNAGSTITVFQAEPPFAVLKTIGPVPNPRHVAVSHDGRHVFVSLFGESGGVVKIDTAVDEVVARSRGTGLRGKTLALSPDDRWIYLANFGSNTISILSADSLVEMSRYATGREPCGLAVSRDGRRLYTTDWEDDQVRLWEVVVRAPGGPALLQLSGSR